MENIVDSYAWVTQQYKRKHTQHIHSEVTSGESVKFVIKYICLERNSLDDGRLKKPLNTGKAQILFD